MRKIIITLFLIFVCEFTYSQSQKLDFLLENDKISDCEKLMNLQKLNKISFSQSFIKYINILEQKTNIRSSLIASENGLIYSSKKKYCSDIKKWMKYFKCN